MPQEQPTPTMYDALGRPLVNKGIGYVRDKATGYLWDKFGKPILDQYGRPLWEKYFGPSESTPATQTGGGLSGLGAGSGAATSGAETTGLGATDLATLSSTGTGGAGSGLGGLSAGGYATVAAPLIMAYLKYQAGSGVNEPLWKAAQTRGAGRMLSDTMAGKKIDPNNSYADYGLANKYLPSWMAGADSQVVDPRGYTPFELYDLMHSYTAGRPQTGGLGTTNWRDQDIDDMFGDNKGKLSKLLGVENLPDWSKHDWSKGFDKGEKTPYSVGQKQAMDKWVFDNPGYAQEQGYNLADYNQGYNALDETTKYNLTLQSQNDNNAGLNPSELWQRRQEQAAVEKLLGYRLKRDQEGGW